MKNNIEPLQPNSFYHIYNRGINGEALFKEEPNYAYFLKKYDQYVSPVVDTYAYCLMSNHFHFLIKTKSEEEIRFPTIEGFVMPTIEGFAPSEPFDREGSEPLVDKGKHIDKPISWILGNSFASLFKSYAMAINKVHSRTGRLFEDPFRRVLVDNESYFTRLIYYIHTNPQKHGFVNDFRDYPYTSYHSHVSKAHTKLQREEVIRWFGSQKEYEKFHFQNDVGSDLEYVIEFD
jgi:putative transposase